MRFSITYGFMTFCYPYIKLPSREIQKKLSAHGLIQKSKYYLQSWGIESAKSGKKYDKALKAFSTIFWSSKNDIFEGAASLHTYCTSKFSLCSSIWLIRGLVELTWAIHQKIILQTLWLICCWTVIGSVWREDVEYSTLIERSCLNK